MNAFTAASALLFLCGLIIVIADDDKEREKHYEDKNDHEHHEMKRSASQNAPQRVVIIRDIEDGITRFLR